VVVGGSHEKGEKPMSVELCSRPRLDFTLVIGGGKEAEDQRGGQCEALVRGVNSQYPPPGTRFLGGKGDGKGGELGGTTSTLKGAKLAVRKDVLRLHRRGEKKRQRRVDNNGKGVRGTADPSFILIVHV